MLHKTLLPYMATNDHDYTASTGISSRSPGRVRSGRGRARSLALHDEESDRGPKGFVRFLIRPYGMFDSKTELPCTGLG